MRQGLSVPGGRKKLKNPASEKEAMAETAKENEHTEEGGRTKAHYRALSL